MALCTILRAIILSAFLVWSAHVGNREDRAEYNRLHTTGDDGNWLLLLHARQELKTVVFLLAGVIVMLGVVAERIGPG